MNVGSLHWAAVSFQHIDLSSGVNFTSDPQIPARILPQERLKRGRVCLPNVTLLTSKKSVESTFLNPSHWQVLHSC